MKSFTLATSIALCTTLLTPFANADFTCNARNARDLMSVLPRPASGGSSGGSSGGTSFGGGGGGLTIPVIQNGGCSFLLAAGGTCTTKKAKRVAAPVGIAGRQTTGGVSFPCPNRMTCVTYEGGMGCIDLSNLDFIDDDGSCGNINTGETIQNCVQVTGGTSTASAAASARTGTATAAAAAASKTSSSSSSSSSNTANGADGMKMSSGLIGTVAGVLALLYV